MTTVVLIFVGIQALGFVLLYYILKKRLEGSIQSSKMEERIRDELNSVMVELNRTTEQNVGLIEDRIKNLQALLAKADKKITLVRRELEKHDASQSVYSRLKAPPPKKTQEKTGYLQREVLKLYREGFSAGVIAGHVGTTVGEVELIISLDKQKG